MSAEDYHLLLEKSQSLAQLQGHLLKILSNFGFSHFAYVPIDPPRDKRYRMITPESAAVDEAYPEFVSTFPTSWVEHYLSQDYSNVDPTYSHAAVTIFPFLWDELFKENWFTAQHRSFFNEAADFGVRAGVTIPLHGPLSGLATLNLAGDLRGKELQGTFQQHQVDLMRVAFSAHEMMLRFLSLHPDQDQVKLTTRERECLLWTSRGKTNWEVGEILNISSETVRFHLKNAMHKMGVYSQHHAAVRAIMRSMIFP